MSKDNNASGKGEHEVSERLAKKLAEVRQKKQAETVRTREYYRGPHTISDQLAKKISENRAKRERKDAQAREIVRKGIISSVARHFPALSRNLRKSIRADDYGTITEDNRNEVALRFFASMKIDFSQLQESEAVALLISEVDKLSQKYKEEDFDPASYPENGHEFEYWLADALGKFGWETQVTTGSGDQGVDVVARKASMTVAIQAKRYTGNVGNKAVQEIYAGALHLGIKAAAVITTTGFTKSAVELSSSTGVKLLTVEDLPHLEEVLQEEK
ncbi:restriction endonuclease [Phaeobacter gallaeciensis]|uniref:restriction endonuclease n=1 Tax=Phaeobacter gallaeciensis TaxID=60890 RepID=UPI000BBB888F|nr:restriction endonuclease [Phaeobacter gallaeciensis]ATF19707.1 Restriction endonuclease [Phaeobacter gallaeciensis]ATF23816.1 Restriction endonuclease [Phaeobacter gallaeciensis]